MKAQHPITKTICQKTETGPYRMMPGSVRVLAAAMFVTVACAVTIKAQAQVVDFEDDRFTGVSADLGRVKLEGGIAVIQRNFRFFVEFTDTGSGWVEGPTQAAPAIDEKFAFHGNVLVAGAMAETSQTGAVYVYRRDGSGWLFEQRLTASDAQTFRLFGTAVDVEDDLIVVGNRWHGAHGTQAGAIYVFRFSGGGWTEEQRIIPTEIGEFDRFGWSVRIENGTIFASAPMQSSGGATYVFEHVGGTWELTQELHGTGSTSAFGLRIDAKGDVVAISSNRRGSLRSGTVYVFRLVGGQWIEEQALESFDPTDNDDFGSSVAVETDLIACGVPNRLETTGFIDLFRYNGSAWIFSQRLQVSDLTRRGELGRRDSIAVSGDTLIATAVGAANVFDISANTGFGNSVVVQDQIGDIGVTITYSTIEAAGSTTVTTDTSSGAPNGFRLTTPRLVFDIETTATFSGTVEVCLDYSGVQIQGNENRLRILHSEDGSDWTDVTSFHDTVNDIICGEVNSFSFLGVFEILDADNDGLSDEEELALGTDPDNPDTDGDGMLDGAEVDIALDGCPDPLNPDSDGDTLLDGEELVLGTSLCNPDTDGDTVPDQIDPDPLTPHDAMSEVEEALRLRADLIGTFSLGLFNGPNANANLGRRNALSSHIRQAANFTAAGNIDAALSQLMLVLDRVDGEDPPPDWMCASSQRDELKEDLEILILLLILL